MLHCNRKSLLNVDNDTKRETALCGKKKNGSYAEHKQLFLKGICQMDLLVTQKSLVWQFLQLTPFTEGKVCVVCESKVGGLLLTFSLFETLHSKG